MNFLERTDIDWNGYIESKRERCSHISTEEYNWYNRNMYMCVYST